jgi:tRNA threonylcarbamoyladenosine biosynthesis protein TsaB
MTGAPAEFHPQSAPVLGIETSGPVGGIALFRGDDCLRESQLEEAPRRHAQTLVAQIGTLVRAAGYRVRDLSAVTVSIGPGSFTGLRVGVVCAKTLAYATGCRLAAVDTLRAIAVNSPVDVARVHVLADALRGDAYVASYERVDGTWTAQTPPALAGAAAWLAERQPGDVLSGPGLAVYATHVAQECRQLPADCSTPRARVVAQLGLEQLVRGEAADCAALVPFYLRRSAAEERKMRSE